MLMLRRNHFVEFWFSLKNIDILIFRIIPMSVDIKLYRDSIHYFKKVNTILGMKTLENPFNSLRTRRTFHSEAHSSVLLPVASHFFDISEKQMKAAFDLLKICLDLFHALRTIRGAASPVTIQSRQSERVQPSGGGVWVGREKKGERRKTGKGTQSRNGGGRWIYYNFTS